MIRWKDIFKKAIFSIMMLASMVSYAQEDKLYRARTLYDTKIPSNIDLAVLTIDSCVKDPKTHGDFQAWTLRAYIYKEIYNRTDKFKLNSKLRDTVIASIKMSNQLKPDSTIRDYNQKLLKNMAAGYMSIAKKLIEDSVNYDRSLIAYNRYKALYLIFDPKKNFHAEDVVYYLAVSTAYNEKYSKDSTEKCLEISKASYHKVLEMEPENKSANMGLGLMSYNQAVSMSKTLEYDTPIDQIEAVQDKMVNLAKQGEQFILKVYNSDKKDPKAVEALFYIYRMLFDQVKYEEFRKKAIEMGISVPDEKSGEGNK